MSPYNVIIAPYSFKERMSAKEAALAIKDGNHT
jgi:Glycerate kinase family.